MFSFPASNCLLFAMSRLSSKLAALSNGSLDRTRVSRRRFYRATFPREAKYKLMHWPRAGQKEAGEEKEKGD